MSKLFRKLVFCGCSSRSGPDSRSIVVDESIVDDPPKFTEFPNRKTETEDLAWHFDLSGIKFIDDDEEADEDEPCTKNGSRRSIGLFFFYRKVG